MPKQPPPKQKEKVRVSAHTKPKRRTQKSQSLEPPEFLHGPGCYELAKGVKFVARDYPLDLIAQVAARLLKATADKDYADAAERAISLLSACELRRDWHTMARREVREMVLRTLEYPPGSSLPGTPGIPYKTGIQILTGQQRADRAEADYGRYVQECSPQCTAEQVKAYIEQRRLVGFYQLPLEAERRRFQELHAGGRLGKRKSPISKQKHSKKSVDAKSDQAGDTKAKKPAMKKPKVDK